MKLLMSYLARIPECVLAFVLAGFCFASVPARACTIFVLTDTNRTLFCNNEDWSDFQTKIWFLPGDHKYYGAVYVGYENGFAQGGMNTKGLAFDWVAGYHEQWEANPHLPYARGNASQRMLETCATVKDAIAFFRTHNEPGFRSAKILVADRTGASVIIGARDDKLQVERENQCRGFGFGQQTLEVALAKHPEPTVANGFKILRDCRQPGQYATKYSNIYDLNTGEIFLYPFPGRDDLVKLNLATELKKGGHYYDMPQIKEQMAQAPRPLPLNMRRFPMDVYKPIRDRESKVTAHLRAMLQDTIEGKPKEDDYTAGEWKKVLAAQPQVPAEMKQIGDFVSMTLVDRSETNGLRIYRYRLKFANLTLLQRVILNGQNKLAGSVTEAVQVNPGAIIPEAPAPPVVGIGVALRVEGQNIVVIGFVPGSPAAAQGDIHVGDRIIAVAQGTGPAVAVQGGKAADAVALIRGPAGTTVRLTIVSPGEDESHARVVSFVRAKLKTPPY